MGPASQGIFDELKAWADSKEWSRRVDMMEDDDPCSRISDAIETVQSVIKRLGTKRNKKAVRSLYALEESLKHARDQHEYLCYLLQEAIDLADRAAQAEREDRLDQRKAAA